MRVWRDRVSPVATFLIALVFLLFGAALGHWSRQPSFADRLLIKRLQRLEERLHSVHEMMAEPQR